jgi:hypothetical protein
MVGCHGRGGAGRCGGAEAQRAGGREFVRCAGRDVSTIMSQRKNPRDIAGLPDGTLLPAGRATGSNGRDACAHSPWVVPFASASASASILARRV